MKNLITKTILAAATFLSLQAQATSLPASFYTVLKLNVAGGMPAPGGTASITVELSADGIMTRTTRSYGPVNDMWNGQTTVSVVGQLNYDEMRQVIQMVHSIQTTELEAPDMPECQDAPAMVYTAARRGETLTFFKQFNCRDFTLQNAVDRAQAEKLKQILDQGLNFPR